VVWDRKFALWVTTLALVLATAQFGLFASATPANTAPFFLPIDVHSDKSRDPSVAVDLAGAVHTGYVGYKSDFSDSSVYYGYCPTQCNDSVNWSAGRLWDLGFGGGAVLALTPVGQPRMMWATYDTLSAHTIYQYATCDLTCTVPSNWTVTNVISAYTGLPNTINYFALDGQGRPRFVYVDDTYPGHIGTFFRSCDSDCTNSGQWNEVRLPVGYTWLPSLAIGANGMPRIAYWSKSSNQVGYVECSAACNVPANWSGTMLYPVDPSSFGSFTLQVNHDGQPRLGVFDGKFLWYAWCNAACTSSQNWDRQGLGLPEGFGDSATLALDSQDRPRFAYIIDYVSGRTFSGLGYGLCLADCESHAPSWQTTIIEASNDLPPVGIQPGCTTGVWFIRGSTSLALGVTGNPHFDYAAEHYQGGKVDNCPFTEDIYRVRFTEWGGNGLLHFAFFPLIGR